MSPIKDDMTYEYDGPRGLVVIHDHVREAINARLDAAIAEVPDAAKERERLYQEIINFYSEYGQLPNFTLKACRS